ncbi:glutaredoxin domain-containing protein [Geomonas propionica]|uniref:NrdH-redoxin n=1 Tax=Geomonas propionica TaxID=2798582 RepID=A0ABS0YUT2_9BACT|nr:glutaredoxin domain-containing protein [Geomonas propionica]MBJ6801735.1 NrdH-redoxin [Geomonas propionica]
MRILMTAILAVTLVCPGLVAGAEQLPQSPLGSHSVQTKYPKVVLFSTSWCPHCKAAKEYFTRNNIPFINRDVELDSAAMEMVTGKYKSQGVPVIVIGEDAKVLKGFDQARFEKALDEVRKKK